MNRVYKKPEMKLIEFSFGDVITKSDWCVGDDPPENKLSTCFGYDSQQDAETSCTPDYSVKQQ